MACLVMDGNMKNPSALYHPIQFMPDDERK
jgi:hypothetical protein